MGNFTSPLHKDHGFCPGHSGLSETREQGVKAFQREVRLESVCIANVHFPLVPGGSICSHR